MTKEEVEAFDYKRGMRKLQFIYVVNSYKIKTQAGLKVLSLHVGTLESILNHSDKINGYDNRVRYVKNRLSGLDNQYLQQNVFVYNICKDPDTKLYREMFGKTSELEGCSDEMIDRLYQVLKYKLSMLQAHAFDPADFGIASRGHENLKPRAVSTPNIGVDPCKKIAHKAPLEEKLNTYTPVGVHNFFNEGKQGIFVGYDPDGKLQSVCTIIDCQLFENYTYKLFELTPEFEKKIIDILGKFEPKYDKFNVEFTARNRDGWRIYTYDGTSYDVSFFLNFVGNDHNLRAEVTELFMEVING